MVTQSQSGGPQVQRLSDGQRLHCHHGPIDLIIEVSADEQEIHRAYQQAEHRFGTVLEELVAELPLLRQPYDPATRFDGETANRMQVAVASANADFITPMAAVAGSVADTVLAAMTEERSFEKAYVNNGGDIALSLQTPHRFRVAIVADQMSGDVLGYIGIGSQDKVGGIATSGWQGRSLSFGVADAVTVLAADAARADAAATLIANAVDVPDSPRIARTAARDIFDDTDLGSRQVTVAVEPLTETEIASALQSGCAVAHDFVNRHAIVAACICLQGSHRLVGDPLLSIQ